MMLVAAVVETSTCASSPRAVDGAREVRLPGHGGVDLLGLERAAAAGGAWREDDVLLDRRAVVGERPDCDEQVEEQEVRRRELRAGDLLALQLLDRR